ncbi:hypothetical protein OAS39_04555 [Pirellulales bacterium]|nr:hypothetical protein [Pirellulales bacterium]
MNEPATSTGLERYTTRAVVCVLLVAAIAYLSIDGHQTKINLLFQGSVFGNCFAEIEDNITWMHGWPVAFYVRNSLDTVKINGSTVAIDIHNDSTFHYSHWPVDDSPTLAFSWVGLTLDIAFLFALTLATWVAMSSFNLPPIRFRIRTLLGAMAGFSFLLAFGFLSSRYLYMFSSLGMIALSMGICCLAGLRVSFSRPSTQLLRDDADRVIP